MSMDLCSDLSADSALPVTRKEHSVTEGGVRGPQNVGNTGSLTNQINDPSAQAAGTANGPAFNGSITNSSTGFSNQVDNAFNTTTNGTTKANGNTTLGAKNPVLTGQS
jgi:hypothetical protein